MLLIAVIAAMTVGLALASGMGPESRARADPGVGRDGLPRAPGTALASSRIGTATPAATAARAEPWIPEGHRPVATTDVVNREPTTDAALAAAWRSHGCAVNPGNPSCLTISLAAACSRDAATPGCDDDRDGDRCVDFTEVIAGFDPLNAGDCIGNRDGAPAINCLFPAGNLPCDAIPGLAPKEVDSVDCGIGIDVERALHPRNPIACATPVASPNPGCAFFDRDPTCDGFARRLY